MNLKDSVTKENLMRSFAGESQARNRYDIAAEQAKKEGLYIIERLFKYTAEQEKAHAKVFYDQLKMYSGTAISFEADYPIDNHNSTLELLNSASNNEHKEHDVVYKNFAETAKSEGFEPISKIFENIASVEKVHGDRFSRYAEELKNGSLFKKNEDVQWICTNCGFIYEGKEAPKYCPVCEYPQGYYILYRNSLFE